jgi:hypothetical protein
MPLLLLPQSQPAPFFTETTVTTLSIDVGYWTGSITYQPSYQSSPIVISIGTGPDANGIAWIWQSITGWDSPDVSGQVLQRGADHGGWATGQWYAPRSMVLMLRASCPNQATRDLARSILQQAIPVNDLAMLQYNEPIPKQMAVRRSGQITEQYDNTEEVVFSCALIAPDPRKYSTVLKQWPSASYIVSSYMTVPFTLPFTLPTAVYVPSTSSTNAGNFETRPVAQITGPLHFPGLKLVNTGQAVTWYNTVLATGDLFIVDFDARMAWHNGAYVPADITSSWWVLEPGTNSIELLSAGFVDTDTGLLIVQHRDAWI